MEDALSNSFGRCLSNTTVSYSPSKDVFKFKDCAPYIREIIEYKYFSDLGCMASLVCRRRCARPDILPDDMREGVAQAWMIADSDAILIVHRLNSERSPPAPPSTSGPTQGVYDWDLKESPDVAMTDSTSKVVLKFQASHKRVPAPEDVATVIMQVWSLIYGSALVYSMVEAKEVLFCLPKVKRANKTLLQKDFSAKNDYLQGFVARPSIPKKVSKCYLVSMRSGMWLYRIASKRLALLNRDRADHPSRTAMLRMPILLYFHNNYGCLDPLVPYACAESEWLADKFGPDRTVYDIGKLEALTRSVRGYLTDQCSNTSVGSIWKLGEFSEGMRCFVNSDEKLAGYRDLVPYAKYAAGRSVYDSGMKLDGLSLLDPANPRTEYTSSPAIEGEDVMFTSKGVLCKLEYSKQCNNAGYLRRVSAVDANVVLYGGSRIYGVPALMESMSLQDGVVYRGRITMKDTLSDLTSTNVTRVGRLSEMESRDVDHTLPTAVKKWSRLTHLSWILLTGKASLTRMNLVTWASLSRCIDLTSENSSMLVITQNTNIFYLAFESIPSSWTVTVLSLDPDVIERDIRGVRTVPRTDCSVLANQTFEYVIMHLCSIEIRSVIVDMHDLLRGLVERSSIAVTYNFDRAMVVESPLNFRYKFGEAQLMTFATSNPDLNVWVYRTHYSEIMECPVDMDESCAVMHSANHTPNPMLPPCHLSDFVPKLPGWNPHEHPEKLKVCMCFCRYSSTSPVMDRYHSRRNFDTVGKIHFKSSEAARVLESELYLVNMPTTKDSLIHSLLMASSRVYSDLGDDDEAKYNLVSEYKAWVKDKLDRGSAATLQVCKGVHILPMKSIEVCIFNVVAGGMVMSTVLPHSASSGADEHRATDCRHPRCVAILRVSDELAYPVASLSPSAPAGYCTIHPTSQLTFIGKQLSSMTKSMVNVYP